VNEILLTGVTLYFNEMISIEKLKLQTVL